MKVAKDMKAKFWTGAAWPGPRDLDVERGLQAVLDEVSTELLTEALMAVSDSDGAAEEIRALAQRLGVKL